MFFRSTQTEITCHGFMLDVLKGIVNILSSVEHNGIYFEECWYQIVDGPRLLP